MTIIRRAGFLWAVLLLLGLWQSASSAATSEVAPGFTRAQAKAGGKAYQQYCVECHGPELEGVAIVPPLAGSRFDQSWRGKSADILSFHLRRMPPLPVAEPGSLGDETYANILAFILKSNDFKPGRKKLPADLAALGTLTIPKLEGVEYDPVVPVEMSAAQAAMLKNLPNVTDQMLRNPSPNDWLHWGRTYNGQSYSPLKQINRDNVKELRPAWRAPLIQGTSMSMPVVHQGVMFLQAYPDTVLAMDATNGAVLWRYKRELPRSSKKMGLSLHEDRIYVSTSDLHVIALNARTGELVWDHTMELGSEGVPRGDYQTRGAPLIAGNVVIQSTLSFRVPKGSYIIGIDRKSGKEAWRFNTVAWPGQPGGNTWNGIPVEERNGGSVWQQGTYDPESNLVYYGIAPTYDTAPLLVPSQEEGVTNEAMYTNCTVALNADTGELVWYFQHTQNDQWDMDWAFERTIAELPTKDGGTVKAVMNVGKNAMLDALDAATGQFLFSLDAGVQNVITAVDPITGAKTIDPTKMPNPENSSVICPVPFGARAWPQTSYSPDTNYVYVPITESCFGITETDKGGRLLTTGVSFTGAPQPDLDDGMMGRVQAIDVANRRLAWNTDQVTPPSTGMLATAGGLVFSGDIDPSLKAFDDATGKLLWQAALDDLPTSSLISYKVGEKQYVAVVLGMTNNFIRDITRHYRRWSNTKGKSGDRGGASIWVFALP
ncbi:MAG: PQQ-binding-like beta-propeller repeat protein [Pseudomonadales bacterium]|jgi:alcohol dehydrogenase (cytochrome c)|nr:PQQ-binding-like beta-propeller repeat protein [Pseudomonadales bacterium]MDP7359816.1 PQQ-binding-like beta-propeller repeat protein [Pseudomonadales bacterium]HJN50657.1 PQQ-binding-like beta-propeller repeat protein [Pseudomonadales bacterium]